MNAKELRIGNYVQRNSRHVKWDFLIEKVDKLVLDKPYGDLPSSYCTPIKLTEEWLLKFGFKHDLNLYGYIINIPQGFIRWDSGSVDINGEMVYCCESVHQLQNLYFALTGEELTYSNL